jgi:hypothetical protein
MKNLTDITLILDESGSMSQSRDRIIEGVNSYIGEQQTLPGDALFSLVTFNDTVTTRFSARNLKDVKPLTLADYVPNGMTALLDALGRVIQTTGARLSSFPASERPSKVIILVQTDGQENASREYSKSGVYNLLKHQQDVYNWTFIFLGANIDSFAEAGEVGIRAYNTANYAMTEQGLKAAYSTMSVATNIARTGRSSKLDLQDIYEDALKRAQAIQS